MEEKRRRRKRRGRKGNWARAMPTTVFCSLKPFRMISLIFRALGWFSLDSRVENGKWIGASSLWSTRSISNNQFRCENQSSQSAFVHLECSERPPGRNLFRGSSHTTDQLNAISAVSDPISVGNIMKHCRATWMANRMSPRWITPGDHCFLAAEAGTRSGTRSGSGTGSGTGAVKQPVNVTTDSCQFESFRPMNWLFIRCQTNWWLGYSSILFQSVQSTSWLHSQRSRKQLFILSHLCLNRINSQSEAALFDWLVRFSFFF